MRADKYVPAPWKPKCDKCELLGEIVISRIVILILAYGLTACGVDTLSSAATGAATKAEEIKQAKKTEDKIKQDLNAALQAGQARQEEAEKGLDKNP